jgi:hypothetical protein
MFNSVPQVKPRSLADVEARSAGTPIGDVRAMAFADSIGATGDTVTIEGVVTARPAVLGSTSALNQTAYIQDATGGIAIFRVATELNVQEGDSLRVTGPIGWFNGELQLSGTATTSPLTIEKLGTGTIPATRTISGAQFLARSFEGSVVRLGNATADSITNVSGTSGGYTLWVTATDGSKLQVRIENTAIGIPARCPPSASRRGSGLPVQRSATPACSAVPRSSAWQRGWNRQPAGIAVGSGVSPRRTICSACVISGTTESSACV